MNINKMEWVEKRKSPNKKTDDVCVRVNGTKSAGYKVYFYFRNNACAFVKEAKSLAVSKIMDNRIYFIANTEFGYAINRPHGRNTASFSVCFVATEEYARKLINTWEKSFDIQYDEECGLYYIENK